MPPLQQEGKGQGRGRGRGQAGTGTGSGKKLSRPQPILKRVEGYVAHLVWRHASPSTLGSSAGPSKKSAEVLTVAQFNLLNALLGYCLDTPTRLLKRLEPQIVAVVRTRLIKQQVEGLFKQHFPTETLPKEDVAWAKKMLDVVSRT